RVSASTLFPYTTLFRSAAMWSWFTKGNLETNDGDSIAEGIGQGRVTKNIEGIKVDRAYRIPDQTGLTIVYQLLRQEGLFLGLSRSEEHTSELQSRVDIV